MKEAYSTATIDLLRDGAKLPEVLSGLKRTLEAKGHQALYSIILKVVERELSGRHNPDTPTVVIANEAAKKTEQQDIKNALAELGTVGEPVYVVEETIVGGFIALAKYKAIDHSYKSQLLTIYQNALN